MILCGLLFLAGLVGLLTGTQMWILENTNGAVFWILEGLWAIFSGIAFSTLAQAAQGRQQATKPLDTSALK